MAIPLSVIDALFPGRWLVKAIFPCGFLVLPAGTAGAQTHAAVAGRYLPVRRTT